jgi:hypothetical protein
MDQANSVHSTPRRTASKTKPVRSTPLQKLCAQFHALSEAHNRACGKLSTVERAAQRAMPKPPLSIQQTKAARADVPFYKYDHRAIPSTFIQSELTNLQSNRSTYEVVAGVVTIRHCEAGFPLTAEQKARVMRLKRMLADAKRYEHACAKVERRFNVAKLQRAITVLFQRETRLIDKIEAVRSANSQDVLAKIRVYRVDPGIFGDVFVEKMLNEVTRELAKGGSR